MTSPSLSLGSRVKLANGLTMPRIHLGVYMISGKEAENAVTYALEAGYRAIDSAQMYNNESSVGHAINSFIRSPANTSSNSPLQRKDIHFTTKLASNTSYTATRKSIKQSIKTSNLEYIDLFLLHSPYGGKEKRWESWKAVEDAIEVGEVKIGGVSNFGFRHLEELLSSSPSIPPSVNQIEVHPFNTHQPLASFCQAHNITVQAYAPLVRALRMKHPTIIELSEKYGCTPAQLMLRWSLQKGYVPLPKSVTKSRIVENGDIGGLEVGAEDMERLDGCDEGLVTDWDPLDAE